MKSSKKTGERPSTPGQGCAAQAFGDAEVGDLHAALQRGTWQGSSVGFWRFQWDSMEFIQGGAP